MTPQRTPVLEDIALSVTETAPTASFEAAFWAMFGDLWLKANDPGDDDSEAATEGEHVAYSH